MNVGIRSILSVLVGFTIGGAAAKIISLKKVNEMKALGAKVPQLYMAFDKWLHIRQKGKSLVEYFERNNYKTIAIYGMKELGERLYDELEGSGITVSYIIDKNADKIYADVDVVNPEQKLKTVDVIVVTAFYYFDEINVLLSEKVDCPIVSLEDILYEV